MRDCRCGPAAGAWRATRVSRAARENFGMKGPFWAFTTPRRSSIRPLTKSRSAAVAELVDAQR
ncbi:hypothetical protein M8756_09375 [Lutimaribacter sp. EGI FJ00015]|nr:hypothetical protein [Lutimaribacter sp. EGI FJ00015]